MAVSSISGSNTVPPNRLAGAARRQQLAEKMFKAMDLDQNGMVSKEEFDQFGDKLRTRGPGNAQLLSQTLLFHGAHQPSDSPKASNSQQAGDIRQANSSQKASRAQLDGAAHEKGGLREANQPRGDHGRHRALGLFKQAGAFSPEELFDSTDTNQDGALGLDELSSMLAEAETRSLATRRPPPGTRGGEALAGPPQDGSGAGQLASIGEVSGLPSTTIANANAAPPGEPDVSPSDSTEANESPASTAAPLDHESKAATAEKLRYALDQAHKALFDAATSLTSLLGEA